jgi:hypothetical protein
MITLRELDDAQTAMLRRTVEGRLTFRARHGHGPHYVWNADSPMPRTATAAEIAVVQELTVKGLLVAPNPTAGAQLVEPTPLGQSLYRQVVRPAGDSESGSSTERVAAAAGLVRDVFDTLNAERSLSDDEQAAHAALREALRWLGYARRDLSRVSR